MVYRDRGTRRRSVSIEQSGGERQGEFTEYHILPGIVIRTRTHTLPIHAHAPTAGIINHYYLEVIFLRYNFVCLPPRVGARACTPRREPDGTPFRRVAPVPLFYSPPHLLLLRLLHHHHHHFLLLHLVHLVFILHPLLLLLLLPLLLLLHGS